MCRFEHCHPHQIPYALFMQLQPIKIAVCGVWILVVLAGAMAIGVSGAGLVPAAAFAFLPPLALLLLWHEPAKTMSEIINQARR